jgi:hypothetical protein
MNPIQSLGKFLLFAGALMVLLGGLVILAGKIGLPLRPPSRGLLFSWKALPVLCPYRNNGPRQPSPDNPHEPSPEVVKSEKLSNPYLL